MDYPQKVALRKIKFSKGASIVPQIGHAKGLQDLQFHPKEPDLLAALDHVPSVRLWSSKTGEVIEILPLPPGKYDAIDWFDDELLAVRCVNDIDAPVWFHIPISDPIRWRPGATPALKRVPRAFVHPEYGPSFLSVDGKGRCLKLRTEDVRGPLHADPLGRYVLHQTPEGTEVFDVKTGQKSGRFGVAEGEVVDLLIEKGGRWAIHLTSEGKVSRFDPAKPERKIQRLAEILGGGRCLTLSLDSQLLAVGSGHGVIDLIQCKNGERLHRTPRAQPGFLREIIFRESVGYVGVRRETLTAYLGDKDYFSATVPLPSFATAACESASLGIYVALQNGSLVELNLSQKVVHPIGESPLPLRLLSSAQNSHVGVDAEGIVWFRKGKNLLRFPISNPSEVTALSTDAKALYVAASYPKMLKIWRFNKPNTPFEVPLEREICAMVFTEHRGKRALAFIDTARVLWRLDVPKGTLRRIGVVEGPDSQTPLNKIIHLTQDQDNTLRILGVGLNAHRLIMLLDFNTAQTTFLMGCIVVGEQLQSIYDEDGVWLRSKELPNVRVINKLRPYSVSEWLRHPDFLDQGIKPTQAPEPKKPHYF